MTAPGHALRRLAASREQIRLALVLDMAAESPPPAPPSDAGAALLQDLLRLPGVAVVAEALHSWWAGHPLRLAVQAGGVVAQAALKPLARRHPWALVLGAFVGGALLARSRPWRWALRPALLAGLLPQLLVTAATRLPLDSWLGMLSAMTAPPPPSDPAAPSTPSVP
jgi:hypothetical protein